jgi:hypothetical protein
MWKNNQMTLKLKTETEQKEFKFEKSKKFIIKYYFFLIRKNQTLNFFEPGFE